MDRKTFITHWYSNIHVFCAMDFGKGLDFTLT